MLQKRESYQYEKGRNRANKCGKVAGDGISRAIREEGCLFGEA